MNAHTRVCLYVCTHVATKPRTRGGTPKPSSSGSRRRRRCPRTRACASSPCLRLLGAWLHIYVSYTYISYRNCYDNYSNSTKQHSMSFWVNIHIHRESEGKNYVRICIYTYTRHVLFAAWSSCGVAGGYEHS